jgi:hypothetical protein
MKVAMASVILLCIFFPPLSLADFNQSDWKFLNPSMDGLLLRVMAPSV